MSSRTSLPRAYVETNFVLELAYSQAEQPSCHDLLDSCKAGEIELAIPMFSLAEPFYAFGGREKTRKRVAEELSKELRELRRGQLPEEVDQAMVEVNSFLAVSLEHEKRGVRAAVDAVATSALLLPMDQEVLTHSATLEADFDLTTPDAIVLASVVRHLTASPVNKAAFLNRNRKDFEDPDIVALLAGLNCKLVPSFAGGLGYLRSALLG